MLAEPVTAVPGDNPMSPPAVPEMVVAPVFVMVLAARTPYVVVVPARTAAGIAAFTAAGKRTANATLAAPTNNFLCEDKQEMRFWFMV
jgi:hypothetical protein